MSPPLGLDPGVREHHVFRDGWHFDAAFDGERYLVAWNDPQEDALRVARLDAEGESLDPGGRILARGPDLTFGWPDGVAVAAGDGEFGVAWIENTRRESRPVLARVRSRDGALLERTEGRWRRTVGDVVFDVAHLGGAYFVGILARDLPLQVGVFRSGGLFHEKTTSLQADAIAMVEGAEHIELALKFEDRLLHARIAGPTDRVRPYRVIAAGGREGARSVDIDALGDRVVMAWTRATDEQTFLHVREFLPSGRSVDFGTREVPAVSVSVSVAATATGAAVGVGDRREGLFVASAEGGELSPLEQVVVSGAQRHIFRKARLVAGEGRVLGLWNEDLDGPQRVGDPHGGVNRAFYEAGSWDRIDTLWSSAPTERVAVASNAEIALVAWAERRGNQRPASAILGVRYRTRDGALLDDEPFDLVSNVEQPQASFDALELASNGEEFLLAWTERTGSIGSGRIRAMRLDPAGRPRGDTAVVHGGPSLSMRVASDGDSFLIGYAARRWIGGGWIDARAVTRAFTPEGLGAAQTVATSEGRITYLDVAATGAGTYAVAFTDCEERIRGCDERTNVRVGPLRLAEVTAERATLLAPFGDDAPLAASPRLTFDGERVTLVWESYDAVGEGANVLGATLGPDLTLRSRLAVRVGGGDQRPSDLTADNAGPLLAWTEGDSAEGGDLFATRILPSGEVGLPLLLERGAHDARCTSPAPGDFLCAYVHGGVRGARVAARFVVYDPRVELE